jgi:hypothetical protein
MPPPTVFALRIIAAERPGNAVCGLSAKENYKISAWAWENLDIEISLQA